ncbi:ferredoxin [Rhodococcus sp. NPDC003382]|uniref:ferredoxin n=1 Tax=unclassified Rhodococcus (in: high G+C Gram-positive bacteria) TaxID=192944 RepID=UPI0018CF64EF|nr:MULTISPECIES: ferredoxin [unclassified Rhodococcus (in: high G+C Gram-positive bacteria)]MBH0123543.1 ferredoxin [Rhodococcus sp. CX]MCK8670375.1 ferredoxin [Rhodococcus sp. HM1]
MKVRVDPDKCQGHTLCAMAAPDVFELSEIDGHASVANEEVPADQEEAVKEAARSCPEQAITIF